MDTWLQTMGTIGVINQKNQKKWKSRRVITTRRRSWQYPSPRAAACRPRDSPPPPAPCTTDNWNSSPEATHKSTLYGTRGSMLASAPAPPPSILIDKPRTWNPVDPRTGSNMYGSSWAAPWEAPGRTRLGQRSHRGLDRPGRGGGVRRWGYGDNLCS